VNKAELIDAIADRIGVDKRTANNAVEAVIDTVTRAVAKGEKVAITGFGVFEKIERPARMGRNPQTGQAVRVKKSSVPKFRPGSQFKGVVNGAVKLAAATTLAAKSTATKAAAPAKRTAAKASSAARGAAGRPAAKKAPAKAAAKKAVVKKAPAKAAAKKAPAKKAPAKKAPARRR